MKKKKIVFISLLFGILLSFNLSAIFDFHPLNFDTKLVEIIQMASADTEYDPTYCEVMCGGPCFLDESWYPCPPNMSMVVAYICAPVCYNAECYISGQADCGHILY